MTLVLENQKDLKMEKDTMENNLKRGNLTIRLDNELLIKYKKICEENGFDMSKRLRLFIESEIIHSEQGVNLTTKLKNVN